MEAQFGLNHVWAQGDWVIRTVALLLLTMSLASWLVILIKALDLRQYWVQARRCEAFWHAPDFDAAMKALGDDAANPFKQLAQTGRDATQHLQAASTDASAAAHLRDQFDLSDWVTRELRNAIDESTAKLQSKMTILASVGSTAPFVGLFGTVWGIYHALLGIGVAGQATIDKVAGPVGEALIMTALGLAVAIPAVLGYNALVRGNKRIVLKLNRFAHDLHAYWVTGARVQTAGKGAQVIAIKKV
jgi:biopolymer transport protein ExbB